MQHAGKCSVHGESVITTKYNRYVDGNCSVTLENIIRDCNALQQCPFKLILKYYCNERFLNVKTDLSEILSETACIDSFYENTIVLIMDQVDFVKRMEVARRGMIVSNLLPPISRLEFNSFVRYKEAGKQYILVERERRVIIQSYLMQLSLCLYSVIQEHLVALHHSPLLLFPSVVFSEQSLEASQSNALRQELCLNLESFKQLQSSLHEDMLLLLTSLDSILHYCRVTIQLLLLSFYFIRQSPLSLHLSFSPPSFPSLPLPTPHIHTIEYIHTTHTVSSRFATLQNTLQSALLTLHSIEQTQCTEEQIEILLKTGRETILHAYDQIINHASQSSITTAGDKMVHETSGDIVVTPQGEEQDGTMYIYQGVSKSLTSDPCLLQKLSNHKRVDKSKQQQLMREVEAMQQEKFRSMPTVFVGDDIQFDSNPERSQHESNITSHTVQSFFSFLPKRYVEEDVMVLL